MRLTHSLIPSVKLSEGKRYELLSRPTHWITGVSRSRSMDLSYVHSVTRVRKYLEEDNSKSTLIYLTLLNPIIIIRFRASSWTVQERSAYHYNDKSVADQSICHWNIVAVCVDIQTYTLTNLLPWNTYANELPRLLKNTISCPTLSPTIEDQPADIWFFNRSSWIQNSKMLPSLVTSTNV